MRSFYYKNDFYLPSFFELIHSCFSKAKREEIKEENRAREKGYRILEMGNGEYVVEVRQWHMWNFDSHDGIEWQRFNKRYKTLEEAKNALSEYFERISTNHGSETVKEIIKL